MTTELPKVIVTGYYDGPTEGLIRSVDDSYFFFKLVAWDDQQDQRVLALKRVDIKIYQEIANILEDAIKSNTWKPFWSFSDKQQGKKAANLLQSCRLEKRVDFLVLGEHIDKKVKIITPNSEVAGKTIVLLANNEIDSIEGWLGLFDDASEVEF